MTLRLFVLALTVLVPGVQLVAQGDNPERSIVVNANHVIGPHSTTPLMTVGAGRANEGLRADWQQQLSILQKEIGFKYLRFHGLLHDDMGVYTEDAAGNPIYNFQYVDQLYDALLSLHIRPFVELSFMPAALASDTKTVFWWKANISPPKDLAKWNGLIGALLEHWRERYGEPEIVQWYYEVWNEPDLSMFWSGTQQQYFDLYSGTVKTIKEICARCRVGGPATAGGVYEPQWLAYVAAQHLPADFLSTHTYGVKAGAFDADGHAGTVLDGSPDSIVGRVAKSRGTIRASATPDLELHYTEWSTSYTPTDFVHDQYISAAFILQKLRETSPLAQSMSYWTFTDIFEENGPRDSPFHGGFGMLNYQSIRKPSFFAYKFLAQLGPSDLESRDAQSWVTKSNNGSIQALIWNYTPVVPPSESTDQIFFKMEQPSQPSSPAKLQIDNLKNGRYKLNVYRTGYRRNDAYTAYLQMGSPHQLTRAQVVALQAATNDAPVETRTVVVKDGTFRHQFDMRENDTILVKLDRQ